MTATATEKALFVRPCICLSHIAHSAHREAWGLPAIAVSSPRTFVLLLNILVIVAIAATSGLTIWDNRQATLEEHQNEMKSMGVVLAEQTSPVTCR